MSSIDQRVVQMQFDNKQFENGINTSTSSLDRLKKSLNLNGAITSLSNLDKVGKNFSLAGIAAGVDNLSNRFSNLGIVGMTALQNITNSVVNTGRSLISALTVDPVKMGFDEYETKMNAIQTIMTNTASKGTTMGDVTNALEQLNTYADQTIYDFAEMTRNIGTFTAAGVDLNTSVSAIKGIANLAAGSGSNALQASTAMYQLSQALAAGKVSLQDWNSVVNAGMGGELFQKALEKTAAELGHGRNMAVSFRDSLQDGWITTEVLTKTLNKFADDPSLIQAATQVKTLTQLIDTMKESVQSGWAQTWELIFGNKDEAAAVFTAINNVFGEIIKSSADARNNILAFWKANGGREAMIEGIANVFRGLTSVLKPIKDAWREVFPPASGQLLVDISKAFRSLTSIFKIGDNTAAVLKVSFKSLFLVIDAGVKTVEFIVKTLFSFGSIVVSVVKGLGNLLIKLKDAITQSDIFNKTLKLIRSAAESLKSVITFLSSVISKGFDIASQAIIPFVLEILKAISTTTIFSDAMDGMKYVFDQISTKANNLSVEINNLTTKSISGMINIFNKAKQTIIWFGNELEKAYNIIKQYLAPILDSLSEKLNNVSLGDITGVLAGIGTLLAGGGILKLAKSFKGMFDSVGDITEGFVKVLDGVTGSLEAFQTKLKADALLKIGIAIGILALAIVALSMIDPQALAKAMVALTIVFMELTTSLGILQKAIFGAPGLSANLIAIGIAVLLIASAMKKLSDIDSGKLSQGIEGLSAMLTVLAVFVKVTSNTTGIQNGIGSLIGISIGVLILASAVEKFGNIDPSKMEQGIQGIVTSLASLAIFIKLVGAPERMISLGIGVGLLGGAMLLFASAVALFGSIPLGNLISGLSGLALSLGAITLAINLMPKDASFIAIGIGLTIMGAALYLIAGAVAIFGSMSIDTLATGIIALAGALLVMAAAANLMTGTLAGSASILVMAAAINVLVPAIVILGNLDLKVIGVALLALAGVFVLLGVSALVLAPLAPVILTLAASVAILGAGIFAIGAGLVLFATGLTALAVAAVPAGGAIVLILVSVAKGLVEFARVIGEGAPVIATAFLKVLFSIIDTINIATPKVVDCILQFIMTLLTKLNGAIPSIMDVAANVIMEFLASINAHLPAILDAAINIVITFMDGINARLPEIIDSAFKLVISFINGLSQAIDNNHDSIYTACYNLIMSIISAMADLVPLLSDVGVNIIKGIIAGFKGMATALVDAAKGVVGDAVQGVKDFLGIHSPSRVFRDEVGAMMAIGMANGIKAHAKEVKDASTEMTKDAFDTAKEWIDKRKYYNTISLQEEYYVWTELQKKYKAGTEERDKIDKEAYRIKNELIQQDYDNSVKKIDDKKYYNEMSLGQELRAWEDIQNKYAKGTEEREKADKEVYRIKNELRQQDYNDSIKYIDDLKYYNKLSLQDELKAWQAIQQKYKVGTEEREKADKEVYRIKNEIADQDFNNQTKRIDDQKYYSQLSLNDELKIWQNIQKQYKEGTEEREKADKEVYRIKNDIRQKDYNDAVQKIDDLKYYNKLSLQDELKAWQAIQKQYAKGTDERIKADKEVYRIENEIQKDGYDKSVEWINDKKYYNQLSLTEELAAWERVQKRYKEGTDERIKADKEVYRVKNELIQKQKQIDDDYASKSKSINDKLASDIKSLNDAYTQAVESKTNSLYTAYGLFDKLSAQTPVSGRRLTKNLEDQIKNFDEWQANINSLSQKGVGDDFIKEIRDMGQKSAVQIKALNSMSQPELNNYVSLWKTKHDEAKNEALSELDSLKTETSIKIAALRTQAAIDLTALRAEWQSQMDQLNSTSDQQLTTIETTYDTKVDKITTDTETKFKDMGTTIQNMDWVGIGNNIVNGMIAGIQAKARELAQIAAEVALQALNAAKAALGIQSPSRAFAEIGMYADKGFAVGLTKYAGLVEDSAGDIGTNAVTALKSTISNISDIINGNVDISPVIRPVLDLSNIEDGSKMIDSMLSKPKGLNVSSISNKVPKITIGRSSDQSQEIKEPSGSRDTNIKFVQNNYSPKPLSRLEIYRQTRNQISTVKGLIKS